MKLKVFAALGLAAVALQAQGIPPNPAYVLGPDSRPKPGVPVGKVNQFTFNASKVFPDTTRAVSVYIPAQYDGAKPACLMVFLDGSGYAANDPKNLNGAHAPTVFDNLIADGSMPVTIAVFVDPGVTPALTPDQMARYQRSLEYDGLGDRHARFLIDELIPEVEKRFSVKISANPDDRGVAGGSSGGIAAFVAAWERPDSFHRAISYIGSFASLRGGDTLAGLIRKMEPKPLRVFMQDGANDQSIYGGSWYLANQAVAGSLEYAGYDVKFVVGTEGHSGRHGNAILPEALRWIWRDYPKPIVASTGGPGQRHYITDFLDPASDWRVVGQGYGGATALAVAKDGSVYFADTKAGSLYRVDAEGKTAVFRKNAGAVTSLMFGSDGRLYGAEPARGRIVSWGPDGSERAIAVGGAPTHLAVTSRGLIYYTDPAERSVGLIDAGGRRQVVFRGAGERDFVSPAGLRLSPDEHLLDVADRDGRWVWSFEIGPDNGLRGGMAFHHLEAPDDSSVTGATEMTLDNTGHLYVATDLGIQISDQPGRMVGIIRGPKPGPVTSIVFGGPDLQTLYATTSDAIYARRLRRTGVYPWIPVKLPRPQL